jgi:AraC family transcriptional regulator, regulatory protein of adaptative response / DNA-3-methyladenine glycosylase II
MELDGDHCFRAMISRDSRFDGCFVVAVRSTRIYCRPSCPAMTPRRENVDFFVAAATAQQRGYRACKRCRPDATPGSPEWSIRADVVGRLMRLIADGVVDREGVSGLATRVGYSERQVHRLLVAEVGSGPLAVARAQRAQTARILLETTTMPVTSVAFAAGFSSIRQFNDTIAEVFALTPTQLRARRKPQPGDEATLTVRLAVRPPFDAMHLLDFFAARAVPGVEHVSDGSYWRSLRLQGGAAVVRLTPGDDAVMCSMWLDDVADAQSAVQRCRRMLDLDADPHRITDVLGVDPVISAMVARRAGVWRARAAQPRPPRRCGVVDPCHSRPADFGEGRTDADDTPRSLVRRRVARPDRPDHAPVSGSVGPRSNATRAVGDACVASAITDRCERIACGWSHHRRRRQRS